MAVAALFRSRRKEVDAAGSGIAIWSRREVLEEVHQREVAWFSAQGESVSFEDEVPGPKVHDGQVNGSIIPRCKLSEPCTAFRSQSDRRANLPLNIHIDCCSLSRQCFTLGLQPLDELIKRPRARCHGAVTLMLVAGGISVGSGRPFAAAALPSNDPGPNTRPQPLPAS